MKQNMKPKKIKSQIIERSADEEKIKYVVAFIGIILFVFLALVVIFKYVSTPTSLTDLHTKNLQQGGKTPDAYIYEGFSFIKRDGLWHTQIEDENAGRIYNIPLHYGPHDVEDVLVFGNSTKFWKMTLNNSISKYQRQAYLTYDLSDNDQLQFLALAAGELSVNLAEAYGMALVPACTNKNSTACEKLPIVTCANTSSPVIYLSIHDSIPMITMDGNCITLQGRGDTLVKSTDRFLLRLYKIMR